METNMKEEFGKYMYKLLGKGIDPHNLYPDIVSECVEDDKECIYDFSGKNILAGANGEVIKVLPKEGIIKVYDSIEIEDHDYSNEYINLRIFDIKTGQILPDGDLSKEANFTETIDFFGIEKYFKLKEYIDTGDYSQEYREMSNVDDLDDITKLSFYNLFSRNRANILRTKLSEKMHICIKKYNIDKDDPLNESFRKIISNIDNANNICNKLVLFNTNLLCKETVDSINNRLKKLNLIEEQYAYSKIDLFPIQDLIEEYKCYCTPKTNEMVKKYIQVLKDLYGPIDSYAKSRIYIRNALTFSEDKKEERNKRNKMIKKRKKEINEIKGTGLW